MHAHLCMSAHIYTCVHTFYGVHRQFRRQLAEIGTFLPPHESCGVAFKSIALIAEVIETAHQVIELLTEPSC